MRFQQYRLPEKKRNKEIKEKREPGSFYLTTSFAFGEESILLSLLSYLRSLGAVLTALREMIRRCSKGVCSHRQKAVYCDWSFDSSYYKSFT